VKKSENFEFPNKKIKTKSWVWQIFFLTLSIRSVSAVVWRQSETSLPVVNFINIYARVFRTNFWRQSQNVIRKAAKKDVRTKKAREKTLMKLTPGSHFFHSFIERNFSSHRSKIYVHFKRLSDLTLFYNCDWRII